MRLPVLERSLLVDLPPYGLFHLSCWRLVSPIQLLSSVSGLHHNEGLWCSDPSFVMATTLDKLHCAAGVMLHCIHIVFSAGDTA